MPGVWSITQTELGQVDEYAPFSHSITYTNAELGGTYSVVLSTTDSNETVYISGNNISGYYTDSFNVNINYKNTKNKFIDTNNFRKIPTEQLKEVIKYSPDLTPYRTYNYTASAIDVATKQVVETKSYTKTLNNNWDLNKNLLKQYVNSTTITDPSLFVPWINSINAATVLWRNASNVTINWA